MTRCQFEYMRLTADIDGNLAKMLSNEYLSPEGDKSAAHVEPGDDSFFDDLSISSTLNEVLRRGSATVASAHDDDIVNIVIPQIDY